MPAPTLLVRYRCDFIARIPVSFQSLQVGANVSRTLITEAAIFLQTLADDLFQFGRRVRIQPYCGGWRSIQDRVKDHTARVPSKRKHPGTHFVQNDAEREQVGPAIEFLPSHLLG